MTFKEEDIGENHVVYLGDCMEVMPSFPAESVHLSIYSPPFAGLYHYSSSPRDMSNCDSYEQFMEHYEFVIREVFRLTVPGRMTAVHCADIPSGNSGMDHLKDFPGDIIRLHESLGFHYVARYSVWKEPFAVRMRTLAKGLAHRTIVEDSSRCTNAAADYLLVFRKKGQNPIPIAHPVGMSEYAGERPIPEDLLSYRGWTGKQTENRLSHWIWRQYASAFWDDVRGNRILPFRESKEQEDEKHVHPLQLDIIERAVVLWSNPGETVFTPFLGVGSEVFVPVQMNRRGVGVELKETYFRQACANLKAAERVASNQAPLFAALEESA